MNLKTLNFHLSEVGPGGALLSSKLFRGVAPWGDTSFVVFFLYALFQMKLCVTLDNGGGSNGAPTLSIMSLGHDTYNPDTQ